NSGHMYISIISDISVSCQSSSTYTSWDYDVYCGEVQEPEVDCNDMTIQVTGGLYPGEVSWDVTNSSNVIVASGDADDTVSINLPDGSYTFNMYDSYGDGWNGAVFTVKNGYGTTIA